ncbi:hypothetical protein Pst134EA_031346 [Puccinia striiformis f. sp. tritici]|uniref:uncharacterized protein n=1 Tax=Puccinia striiformis f. sp. tritici TaxID=168172 RepID=UPI0020074303|nr:uncharacterized protein Pst134EA_031346 [Puccinia striiformis f. sp. tritici]KAH9445346.1 hypothetical protein Pst134EA_031346 [Puccinia striiformis f. sp. tritici]
MEYDGEGLRRKSGYNPTLARVAVEKETCCQRLETRYLEGGPRILRVHKNLGRILKNRGKTIAEGDQIDWSTAEAMAFGSLLLEGNHVRVSGQDVERGTFSQKDMPSYTIRTRTTLTFH